MNLSIYYSITSKLLNNLKLTILLTIIVSFSVLADGNKQIVTLYKLGDSFRFLIPEENPKKYIISLKNDTLRLDAVGFSAQFEVLGGDVDFNSFLKNSKQITDFFKANEQFIDTGKSLEIQFTHEDSKCRTYNYISIEKISRLTHLCFLPSKNKKTTLSYSISFLNSSKLNRLDFEAAQEALDWMQLQYRNY
jgi:hypothetical protein